MKKFKPFTFLLFILTILFLLFAPEFIRTGLDKTRADAKKNEFTGILSLWHVNGWQTGKAPVSSYLRKCIRSFENKNTYVFIEITTMTPSKAAEKISAGELPDMISFPTGFFSEPSLLMPLDKAEFNNPALSSSCLYNGRAYAYPYLINPYLLFYNQELLFEKEIDEAAFENPTQKQLLEAAQTLSFTRKEGKKQKEVYGMAIQNEYITSPAAGLAFFANEGGEYSSNGNAAITAQTEKGLEFFINKQAAFLLSSATTQDVLKNSAKTPPACQACAFTNFTDMVQYMGVCKTEDANKFNCCKNFIYSLLNEKNAKKAGETGAFPAVPAEGLYEDDLVLKNAGQMLADNGEFPNTFAYGELQKEIKQYEKGALTGDLDSLKKIRRLLSKKLYS